MPLGLSSVARSGSGLRRWSQACGLALMAGGLRCGDMRETDMFAADDDMEKIASKLYDVLVDIANHDNPKKAVKLAQEIVTEIQGKTNDDI